MASTRQPPGDDNPSSPNLRTYIAVTSFEGEEHVVAYVPRFLERLQFSVKGGGVPGFCQRRLVQPRLRLALITLEMVTSLDV